MPSAPVYTFEAASVLSAEALQHTRDAFEDVFIRIRIAAIVSMRGFNYQEAVADLLRLLHDSPPEGQHVAVQSLGEIISNRYPGLQNHADLDMKLITRALDSIWAATG